jgi:hypothetical protein
MHQLVLPKDGLNIGLDYDATATTNIQFWKTFVAAAKAEGYNVFIVTARHANNISEPTAYFEGIVDGIIATGHKAKLPFCQDLGLRIDIFIDDSPWNVYCNIDGSTPKFESLNMMHPNFGEEIANVLFPRNHSLRLHGYGFYYTDMHWEVPLIQQSFHRTKAGAYRAMRAFLLEEWERNWTGYVQDKRRGRYKRQTHWHSPFAHSKWKVLPAVLEVKE